MPIETGPTYDQLIALALDADDPIAARYIELQQQGAMIVSRYPGWEVTYAPRAECPTTPWSDDQDNRFHTAFVGTC